MLYDRFGNPPTRNLDPIIDEMFREGIKYRVVPANKIGSYGENHVRIAEGVVSYGGRDHKVAILENEEICVSEKTPAKFRDIIAAHEFGHQKGLTHREIYRLEWELAKKLSEGDNELLAEYLIWSSSKEMFEHVKGNLGCEAEQGKMDDPKTIYEDAKCRFGAEMIVKREGDNLTQLD